MRPPFRSIAALVGVGLVGASLAACSSPSRPSPPAAGPSPAASPTTTGGPSVITASVHWVKCAHGAGPPGYQCATVMVPRDPLNPALGQIGMAVDRRPASGRKIGSLLVYPGGPGVSGVDFLPDAVAMMPAQLRQRFDVVGFDPPGVGRTAPIVCLDPAGLDRYFHLDPEPSTPAALNSMIAGDRTFASGCESRSAQELPYVSTVDAAMDLDVVRQALGDAQLTYLGFSYGTSLGAAYAELYPSRVRALVLDGALDPALPIITELDQQAAALEGQFQQFFTACAGTPSCPWKPGPDPMGAYEALLARVRATPLPARRTSRTVGPAELLFGTAAALYFTSTWGSLAQALAQATSGDGTDILALFDSYTQRHSDGTYSNLFEANEAVNCLDVPAPTIAQIEAAAPAAAAVAPVFGVQNLYSELNCAVWPVAATGKVGPVHASGAPPIVVVGSTGDPITPYTWAQALAGELDRGVLLTRVGDGHTGYGASSCIRSAVDSYLIDLKVPAAGTRCPTN